MIRKIFILLCFLTPVVNADAVVYQIKASYIYNFLQFVQFAKDRHGNNSTVNVCIVGENKFGNAIDELNNAPVPQGKINIQMFDGDDISNDLLNCQVLYIVGQDISLSKHTLAQINTNEVLTIGESPEFTQLGGFIELFIEKDSVKFRINPKLIGNTRFKVAAQLLSLGVSSDG